ncbi:MAG: hypothetical protein HYR62_04760 [Actinobacteria bacterium]|nr:hypothetical protein [Actinomycetota bacterium]MBI3686470.1 hypothetical protein [Actinomycetota bacterium]
MIDALNVSQVKIVAVVALVVLVLLGALVGFLVQRAILKLGLLAVVVSLIALVWWQRGAVVGCARTGNCSFFGVDVKAVADRIP